MHLKTHHTEEAESVRRLLIHNLQTTHNEQKTTPTVRIEPTATRLKVLRSTTELDGTETRKSGKHAALENRCASARLKKAPPLGIEPRT